MRQIKFRAWDLDHKWMDDHFFIQSNGVVHDTPSKTYDTPNTEIEENPSLVLMQFTGLQDKNGVDIYEGDIVENDRVRFIVEWCDSGKWEAVVINSASEEKGLLYSYGCKYKVIGNIHQPELLEQDNEQR